MSSSLQVAAVEVGFAAVELVQVDYWNMDHNL
jgi:hypothetical protein